MGTDLYVWREAEQGISRELSYAGAGHPPLIIFNSDGIPVKISSQNLIIGVDDQFEFQSGTYHIEDKTELYIYTDGAYEANLPNGNMMKIDNLVNFLLENRNKQADEINKLYDYLIDLNSGRSLDDDFTMMKLSFT